MTMTEDRRPPTWVLVLVAAITLVVAGVGIMNSMLANVQARTREIGIRKALGATRREIRLQFLTEAVFLSFAGGILGTILGLGIPLSVRLLTPYKMPVGWQARGDRAGDFGHCRRCLRHRSRQPRRSARSQSKRSSTNELRRRTNTIRVPRRTRIYMCGSVPLDA